MPLSLKHDLDCKKLILHCWHNVLCIPVMMLWVEFLVGDEL